MVRIFAFAVLLAVLGSCGGGSVFDPYYGPFIGVLLVDAEAVGSITLTTNQGLVGGTGIIDHNGSQITVSISGVITDQNLTGTMANSLLGSGPFAGNFADRGSITGTFSFTDTAEVATTTGTWRADTQ